MTGYSEIIHLDEKRPTRRFECLTIHVSDMPTTHPSLTMLGVSRAFLSTLLPALRGERHFGVFTRDQPDIAGDLLATSKALR